MLQEPPTTVIAERRTVREPFTRTPSAAQTGASRPQVERFRDFHGNLQDSFVRAEKPEDDTGGEGLVGERIVHARDRRGASPSRSARPNDPGGAEAAGRPITVLVADDHAMVREGMAQMLSLNDDIEVVAQAGDGREAVALARETRPDVVILDVEMPVMGAQAALKRLLEFQAPPKVIVVTVFADRRLVRELLGLGASAFLSKSSSSQVLISTVRSVAQSPHDGNVTVTVPREEYDAEGSAESELSNRETEVLRMVARGAGNKEVAETLHLSETTVKRHLSNVYDKLGVHTRGEAVSKAVSEGWISSWDIVRD